MDKAAQSQRRADLLAKADEYDRLADEWREDVRRHMLEQAAIFQRAADAMAPAQEPTKESMLLLFPSPTRSERDDRIHSGIIAVGKAGDTTEVSGARESQPLDAMTIRFAMLALACLLSGCAGSPLAERDARSNYEKSVANYRTCLAATHQSVSACEAQRRTMDADERAFNNLSADVNTK